MKIKTTILFSIVAFSACALSADETVSGQLTVDQDNTNTALAVKGGTSGTPLAVFIRDNGTGSDVAQVRIDAGANNPEMSFSDYSTAGTWVLGLKNSDNSFRISQSSNLHAQENNYFTIKNDGKVGIGTINPRGNLDVSGSFYTGTGVIRVDLQNDSYEGGEIILSSNSDYDSSFNDWHIDSFDRFFRVFNSGGAMFNMDQTGNVGIGASHNSRKLRVHSDNSGIAMFDAPHGNFQIFNTSLQFVSTITNGNPHFFLQDQDNSDSRYLIEGLGGGGSVDAFYVTSSGKTGLGVVPSGDYRLEVNGAIRAKEIIVESGWADFVFEDDYELMPLEEVDGFIEENNRLPGMPSAEEVQQDGVSLGDMQTIMLQKLEELTLHMIDLKKENEALKQRVQELESKEVEVQ